MEAMIEFITKDRAREMAKEKELLSAREICLLAAQINPTGITNEMFDELLGRLPQLVVATKNFVAMAEAGKFPFVTFQ